MTPRTLSASSINGTSVKNLAGTDLGNIQDLMINTNNGDIAYAVLSFGGFLGFGDKYFAIPWEAFTMDPYKECLVLSVPEEKLKNAPGFDKDNWPSHATHEHLTNVYNHYGYRPNWN